ncbi:OB-fold domain-containing protein [Nocardia sp. CA2R105]|uniref:Zn-ribbon domain-containing OB-fold protein n=1 Tax=Nocardia coffeae TaxID=2873381 RepID=UPI001CA73522|nr:OB-fold domain-containing protein [Nocardia coffeae]MBY8862901.1 OB-fold domain-containing protein [Nocardia coffeae]
MNTPYYAGLLEHRLLAGHCEECGVWHTPLRSRCPSCWSATVAPKEVSGHGHIHVLTLLHQGPPGVPYSPPWPLAAIELAEQPGLRVAATLVDTPIEHQRIGQAVELAWIERDGAPWPAFRAVVQ